MPDNAMVSMMDDWVAMKMTIGGIISTRATAAEARPGPYRRW